MYIDSREDLENRTETSLSGDQTQNIAVTKYLIEVVQKLSLAGDLQEIIDLVCRSARILTGSDGTTFVLREGELSYYVNEDAIDPLWKGQKFPLDNCISGWCIKHGQSVTIADVFTDERIPLSVYESTFVKSLVMVPIRQIEPIGAIGNYWASQHLATVEEVNMLQSLADATSIAIEKIQIHTDLQDKTAELEDLYNNAPCGYHSLDRDGKYLRINDTELAMLGYTRAEIIGKKTVTELLTPASLEIFNTNFPIFKQQGWIDDLELEMIRQDGTTIALSLSARLVYDRDGNYLMSRSVVLDISERVRIRAEHQKDIAAEQAALHERDRVETDLRQSEERLRLALAGANAGTWDFDVFTGDLTWSPETYLLYGLDPDRGAPEYADWLEHSVHPDDRTAIGEQIFKTIEQSRPEIQFEFRIRHPQRGIRWLICLGRLTLTKQGAPLRISGINLDITDRKQSEQLLERFFAVAADLQVITGNNGYFHWVSPTFEHSLGWSIAEMISRPWIDFVHPDDIDLSVLETTNLFAGNETLAFENRFRHKDGSYRWLLWKAQAYPEEQLIYGAAVDITERKLAEQKIQEQAALIDIATDAIFVCDLDLRIVFWSLGAERLYGWESTAAIGQDAAELLRSQDGNTIDTAYQTLFSQGKWQGQIKEQTQANRSVTVESRWTLVRDAADNAQSILIVNTDITEKKQLETQFLRAQRLESLGTLASGIAHDLNNILTPILGVAQLLPLKLPDLDERNRSLVQILEESAKRGTNLVKQILSFARGSDGSRSSLQLRHILAEVVRVARQTFPKSIDISLNLNTTELWTIAADSSQLHQVLMNLTINARDAMPEGGNLSIAADNITLDENYARLNIDALVGPYVVVTIADTGVGIPPELLDRIFEPFFTTKATGQGTGLGLSTTIGIIKSHGGFVSVYSELGQGSRFNIYLPAEISAAPDLVIDSGELPFGHGELVLIVDDEVSVREITKTTLEAHNYQAITANDGIEAIAIYAEKKSAIKFVLLDLMMPFLDSPSTIRALQKIDPHVSIVVMSGLSANQPIKNISDLHVQSFLAKPFTSAQLLQTIDRLRVEKELS